MASDFTGNAAVTLPWKLPYGTPPDYSYATVLDDRWEGTRLHSVEYSATRQDDGRWLAECILILGDTYATGAEITVWSATATTLELAELSCERHAEWFLSVA